MLLHNFHLLFLLQPEAHETECLSVEQGTKRPGDLVHLQDVVTNSSPKDLSSVVPWRKTSGDVSSWFSWHWSHLSFLPVKKDVYHQTLLWSQREVDNISLSFDYSSRILFWDKEFTIVVGCQVSLPLNIQWNEKKNTLPLSLQLILSGNLIFFFRLLIKLWPQKYTFCSCCLQQRMHLVSSSALELPCVPPGAKQLQFCLLLLSKKENKSVGNHL